MNARTGRSVRDKQYWQQLVPKSWHPGKRKLREDACGTPEQPALQPQPPEWPDDRQN